MSHFRAPLGVLFAIYVVPFFFFNLPSRKCDNFAEEAFGGLLGWAHSGKDLVWKKKTFVPTVASSS